MLQHKVIVNDREIRVVGDPTIVRNNVKVDTLQAEFDSAWDGMEAINVFFKNGDTVIFQQYVEGMFIPWEVLTSEGSVLLTFKGYRGDDEIIVTRHMKAGFIVKPCGHCHDGVDPEEPTPSAYEQILEELQAIHEYMDAMQPLIGRLGVDEGYITPSMVYQALQEGRPISVTDKHRSMGDITFNGAAYADDYKAITLHAISQDPMGGAGLWLYSVSALVTEGGWGDMTIMQIADQS